MINLVQHGRNIARGDSTHHAVVLLLQQGGHVSSNGHLLSQLFILHADPPPQLLKETQQTRPALSTGFQVGSGEIIHINQTFITFYAFSALIARAYRVQCSNTRQLVSEPHALLVYCFHFHMQICINIYVEL